MTINALNDEELCQLWLPVKEHYKNALNAWPEGNNKAMFNELQKLMKAAEKVQQRLNELQ